MIISRLRNSWAPAWSRSTSFMTNSTAIDGTMTFRAPQTQQQAEVHQPKRQSPWKSSAAFQLPKTNPEAPQLVKGVARRLGTASITKNPAARNSADTHKMSTSDLQSQSEPHPHPEVHKKRQRKPKNPAWNTSTSPRLLSNNRSNAVQGVQSVFQLLETVSIVNEPAASSAAKSALPPNSAEQAASRSALHLVSQTIAHDKGKTAAPKQKVVVGAGRQEKVDPSPASGGIPNPTNAYLKVCFFTPSQLRQPQHLLIVIDLNGTLLYRPNRKKPTHFNMRPHAQTFLKYCVDTFTVVIWSSARPENVTAMCNTILTPNIKSRVAAIGGRDKFGLTKTDFDLRVQCYKRLTKVWQDPKIAASHPMYRDGFRWDQTNTVLIDDSREKARTEPHNLIEVPEWFGDMHERDDILPQVHDYLNHLSMHSNVSACLQASPWRPTVF